MCFFFNPNYGFSNKLCVTVMTSVELQCSWVKAKTQCVSMCVILSIDVLQKKSNRNPCVVHCESSLCLSRGHQSCQLLIFLRATKHTPVTVHECLSVCVCLYWCIGPFRVRLAPSKLQLGAVWSAVIRFREAETLKVTTAAPLMPVNVTVAGTQRVFSAFLYLPRES